MERLRADSHRAIEPPSPADLSRDTSIVRNYLALKGGHAKSSPCMAYFVHQTIETLCSAPTALNTPPLLFLFILQGEFRQSWAHGSYLIFLCFVRSENYILTIKACLKREYHCEGKHNTASAKARLSVRQGQGIGLRGQAAATSSPSNNRPFRIIALSRRRRYSTPVFANIK